MRRLFVVVASSFLAFAIPALTAQNDLIARARARHRASPLVDGHNDYPWALRQHNEQRDLDALDIRLPQPTIMTDISRMRAGGVGAQFWSVYVPVTIRGPEAARTTMEQIDVVHRMMGRYADVFELARSVSDVERIFRAGRIASMIGIEGGHSIDGSLGALRMFYALGARYMTLTHSSNVPWADSASDAARLGGLSRFGEDVVSEMNRLGMLVDLSHTSPDTMEDAIRVSAAPVIFSHSSARAVTDHPRNVPDSVLKLLPKNGGVVMVTFVPDFVSSDVYQHTQQRTAEQDRLRALYQNDDTRVRVELDAWRASHPSPRATLAQVADHIDHIRRIAGIDHVGLGSDFDGITSVPVGLEDVSTYPALTAELLRRGYSDAEVDKVNGLNVLRAWRRAERAAARLQRDRPPAVSR